MITRDALRLTASTFGCFGATRSLESNGAVSSLAILPAGNVRESSEP